MPYQGRQPGIGVRNRFVYTATGGQTTFSGADSNGKTLAYQDGAYVDVYLNGVMLVPTTDFTATTKTSITLTSGATASDIVEILAYDISSIADTVSKSQGGTFDGSITVNGSFSVDGGTIKLDGNYPVGTSNVALGDTALDSATNAAYNVAVGEKAMTATTTATASVAVGFGAMAANTTGSNNSAFGADALDANTTGADNTAIGGSALTSNTTASNNTAVGYQAGYSNTTATNVVAVGKGAGYSATVNGYSCYVGSNAGLNTTGSENQFFGKEAGYYVTTGSKNTILGAYNGNEGGLDIRTSSNNIVLSDGDGNPRMWFDGNATQWVIDAPRLNSTGVALQNYSGDCADFSVSANDGTRWFASGYSSNAGRRNFFIRSNGSFESYTNSYGGVSDAKLKENVVDASSQWDDVKAVQVRRYNMIGDDALHLGVVAQELEAAGMSGLVSEVSDFDEDGNDLGTTTKSVKYSVLYMKAVKALQEAMERIEQLEADVAALKNP